MKPIKIEYTDPNCVFITAKDTVNKTTVIVCIDNSTGDVSVSTYLKS